MPRKAKPPLPTATQLAAQRLFEKLIAEDPRLAAYCRHLRATRRLRFAYDILPKLHIPGSGFLDTENAW